VSRTAKQLASTYSDPAWRRRFVDLSDLLQILGDCIIPNTYSVPDDVGTTFFLTTRGSQMKDRLIRKEHVPGKEAHLMCALTLGHDELYLDIENTDPNRVKQFIETQLEDRKIHFPYSYGRTLYDTYGDMFEDEKDVLTIDETMRLIGKVPRGVFQYGKYIVGPFGILTSTSERHIQFSRVVPAYHCAQATCHAVHQVRLSTGYDAPINDERTKLHRLLDETSEAAADWWGLALEVEHYSHSFYAESHSATLAALIGDALSDTELRSLIEFLLDNTRGEFRGATTEIIGTGNATQLTQSLEREQMMQLVLLASESTISRALDALVRDNVIHIPRGEVRRPVTNARRRSGAFQLSPELGHLGVRFVSDDPGFASLRQRELLNRLYLRDSETDTEELDWQLRGFDSEDIDERLENFFRSTDPRAALSRMVLARKTNMIAACHYVGLEDAADLSDTSLVESILWKLGFDVRTEVDSHRTFWDLHQRISALTQSSRISGIGESETFRGVASSFFTELEGVLADALAFATWVLLVDHTSEPHPFSYDDTSDRSTAFQRLQQAHDTSGNEVEDFDFISDRTELYPLIRGFDILSKELDRVAMHPEDHTRDTDALPEYEGKTAIKRFLFRSRIPFLNLTPASQKRMKEGLHQVAAGLLRPVEVHQVRNDYSHYRRTSPEIERMAQALDAIAEAIRSLENLGVARLLCFPAGFESDGWGRSKHRFSGPRSIEHLFARPSKFDWMGLPALQTSQYIVRSAIFAEPNEVLRFTPRFVSDFSELWSNYPVRRRGGIPSSVSVEESGPHETNLGVQDQTSSN
jgi:hypothetical protein